MKISQLTEQTVVDLENDFIPFLDASDTAQSSLGSTRKTRFDSFSAPTVIITPTGSDDDIAINAAITTVGKAGGGLIFLKKGQYNLNAGITINYNNIILQGEGWNTLLFKANNFNANVIQYNNDNCVVRDLMVDGNRTNMSSDNHGVVIEGNHNKLLNVYVKSAHHHNINTPSATDILIDGCRSEDSGTGNGQDGVGIIAGAGASNIKIVNCTIYNAGYHGIQIYTDTNKVLIDNCHVTLVGQRTSTGNGIKLNPDVQDVFISNCYFAHSGGNGSGFLTDDTGGLAAISNINIVNCTFEFFDQCGLRFDGTQNVALVNVKARNNGQANPGASTNFGLRINNGTTYQANHYKIINCEFYDNQAVATQAQPIGIYGTSTNIFIDMCEFYGNNVKNDIYYDGSATGTVYYGRNISDTTGSTNAAKNNIVTGGEPRAIITEDDTGANSKRWDFRAQSGVLYIRALSDNDATKTNFMHFTRSSSTATGIVNEVPHTMTPGAAAAGEAPFYLQIGTNLTTPEGGAFEYDGTHLYFTTNDGTRHTLI